MDLIPFKFPITFLKTVGVWQDNKASIYYKIYGILMHLYFLEHGIVLATTLVVQLFLEGNMIEFTEVFSKSLSIYLSVIKSLIFIVNIERIKNLMDKLSYLLKFSDFTKKNRPYITLYETKITKLTKYNYTFHFIICTLSVMMAILSSDRRLPFKTWTYMDYKNDESAYMFMNCAIYIMSLYTTGVNTMMDFYPIIFMCYIIGMLDELGDYLNKAKFHEDHSINFEKITSNLKKPKLNLHKDFVDLRKCISYHIKIKEFCNELSSNYALHFMAQGFFSSLILCSTSFHLTKVR